MVEEVSSLNECVRYKLKAQMFIGNGMANVGKCISFAPYTILYRILIWVLLSYVCTTTYSAQRGVT